MCNYFHYLCVSVYVCLHVPWHEARKKLLEVGFLPPPCRFWGLTQANRIGSECFSPPSSLACLEYVQFFFFFKLGHQFNLAAVEMNTVFWLIMLFRYLEVGGTSAQRAIAMTVILVSEAQGWRGGRTSTTNWFFGPWSSWKRNQLFSPVKFKFLAVSAL